MVACAQEKGDGREREGTIGILVIAMSGEREGARMPWLTSRLLHVRNECHTLAPWNIYVGRDDEARSLACLFSI